MESIITWQQNSDNPENGDNFATIQQWWANLNNQKIAWRQRLITQVGNVREIDWEPQRFDEVFELKSPKFAVLPSTGTNLTPQKNAARHPTSLNLKPSANNFTSIPNLKKNWLSELVSPKSFIKKLKSLIPSAWAPRLEKTTFSCSEISSSKLKSNSPSAQAILSSYQ